MSTNFIKETNMCRELSNEKEMQGSDGIGMLFWHDSLSTICMHYKYTPHQNSI